MIRLCAHLGYQFNEVPFLERFECAAAAGYRAVEFPVPYAYDSGVLADRLARFDLSLVQFAAPMGDTSQGEKGLGALSGRETAFRTSLAQAVHYAQALRCRHIHPMAGVTSETARLDWSTYVANLRFAVACLAEQGMTTLVEVMSEGEVPGYFLSSYERAQALFDAVADPHLTLIFDTYHAQALTGDVKGELMRWAGRIGHVQVSDFPGRHEPGTGMLDFDALFAQLEQSGYDGWVGCEYRPETTTQAGLRYLGKYLTDVRSAS